MKTIFGSLSGCKFAVAVVSLLMLGVVRVAAQSSGSNVDTCNLQTVDWSNDVEETVCITGDATELDAWADNDSYESSDWQNWPNGDPYVVGIGAEGQMYGSDGSSYDTGMGYGGLAPYDGYSGYYQSPPGGSSSTISITPYPNAWYSLDGLYSECYDSSGNGSAYCSWTGASDGGVWVQAQVTGTLPSPTLSLNTSTTTSTFGQQITLSANISNSLQGNVTFYDGSAQIGTGLLDYYGNTSLTVSGLGIGNHTITASWPGDSTYASTTSNSVSESVQASSRTLYSYSITQPDGVTSGYDPVGNIVAYTDSVNGQWTLGYDSLNRLVSSAQPVSPVYMCWGYDNFGNRTSQVLSNQSVSGDGTSCYPQYSSTWSGTNTVYTPANQISYNVDPVAQVSLGSPVQYDASGSGNIVADNLTGSTPHGYLYDGEGRICAVQIPGSPGQMIQYLYDAEGNRIGKGTITQWSCNTDSNGFSLTNEYVVDQGGEQVTELDGNNNWVHTNAYADGELVATYDPLGLHYQLADWLGSRRVQASPAGAIEETCQNLPFGDGASCTPTSASTADDATEQHFTGLEFDPESGLDHALFRQYAFGEGRWMSPDPYDGSMDPGNPQTLNRYAYVNNGPLMYTDRTGLSPTFCVTATIVGGPVAGSACATSVVATAVCGPVCGFLIGGAIGGLGELAELLIGHPHTPPKDSTQPRPKAQNKPQRLTCKGTSYVMKGNPANVGHEGFPGVNVTNGSAAVIPRQFTGQLTGGPVMRQIGSSTFGTVTGTNGVTLSFNGLTQAVGFAKLGSAIDVQNLIMARAPNQLILEIVGGQDLGAGASVTINMPDLGQGCPAGTSLPAVPK